MGSCIGADGPPSEPNSPLLKGSLNLLQQHQREMANEGLGGIGAALDKSALENHNNDYSNINNDMNGSASAMSLASNNVEACQGVVIVLENITKERISQSAIQRYQKRLNEMEAQVQDYAELRNKLQSLEIDDLEQIKPETARALANLALCVNDPIYSTGNSKRLKHTPVRRKASVDDDTMFANAGSPNSVGFLMEHKSVLSAKALKSWNWNCLLVEDQNILGKALTTMFEELNFVDQWTIGTKKLENFISEVNNRYNEVPFHNFKHGVAVAHMSFYFIACTEAGTCLSAVQALSLMVSSLCHDLDHPGHTNAFEVNSGSDLALLYNDTSVLENHHCR